jgi:hypothetical protein
MTIAGLCAFFASDVGLNHFRKPDMPVNCRRESHSGVEESVFSNSKCLYNTYMTPVVELYGLLRRCNHRASVS